MTYKKLPNYVPSPSLNLAVEAAGFLLRCQAGEWQSDDPDGVLAFVATHDSLAGDKALKVAEVKTEAARRIGEIADTGRELKLLREAVVALMAGEKVPDAAKADLDKIAVIAAASNEIEASVNAKTTPAEIASVDVGKSSKWSV